MPRVDGEMGCYQQVLTPPRRFDVPEAEDFGPHRSERVTETVLVPTMIKKYDLSSLQELVRRISHGP
jgi:hypothetical protein